jgi:site-specific recombinase XerD
MYGAKRLGGLSMAAIDVKVIQELLGHIDALIRAIQTVGHVGRLRLRDIRVDEVRYDPPN